MGLSFREFRSDRQAVCIDKGVNLRRQAAATDPCSGIALFFLTIGGLLMNSYRRAIDHLDIPVVSF
jgi:hypothetical protein